MRRALSLLIAFWVRFAARRRAEAELRRMDRARLRDLGITPEQIGAYVRGRVRLPRRPSLRLIEGGAARLRA